MKQSISILVVAALMSTTAFAFQHEAHHQDSPVPAKTVKGVQTITVTVAEGKYTPYAISVKKGVPVAITFKGGAKMGCGSTIEFKILKQKQTVKQGQTVTFKFTPDKAGDVAFACPMGMYTGKVVVK
jgi:plastocyanin domain-containing protein